MSDPILYKGRGTPEMYDDLMDFINYVFGFNGNQSDFKKLLPKLYKPENDPCYANYVVTENGKLKAAIGAFDSKLLVGDETLVCRGIGNVAVHPYSRSKGYMIDCMNAALSDMIQDGVDYSILGGQRQRYNYFGFEHAGPTYTCSINRTNLRHHFRDVPFVELDLHEVEDGEEALIDAMYALHQTRPQRTIRPREKFLDICRSWRSPAVAIRKDGKCIGYYVSNLKELTLADPADFNDVIRNYVRDHGNVDLSFAAWDTTLYDAALKLAEGMSMDHCDMFSIFNYKKVVSAFMHFKAGYETLADGEIAVNIHGYAGDESLLIYVENGVPTVESHSGPCDIELEHCEAIQFFFGLYAPKHRLLPAAIRGWFPLPLYIDSADHV